MTTTRRPGLSLTEVLVALFIMALGAISILTLFPLGALNMAAALRDDRTTQTATQADSMMRYYWAQEVVNPAPVPPTSTTPGSPDPFTVAFTNPAAADTTDGSPALDPAANPTDPSYPVFVDPMGWVDSWTPSTQQLRVANLPGRPRRTLSPVTDPSNGTRTPLPAAQALRMCSLLDGFTFTPAKEGSTSPTGSPVNPDTGTVDREYRYNWLWVVQQPNIGTSARANVTVVVFDKRTHLFVPPNAERMSRPMNGGAAVGTNLVQFAAGTNLGVQKGGWLLDATVARSTDLNDSTIVYTVRNANFYRVLSTTDDGTALTVELHTPLRPDTKPANGRDLPPALAANRTFVVLAGVADVFERPQLDR